jgi:hypothetical protein
MNGMTYALPLWQHLGVALVFLTMGYAFLRSSRKRSSFALDDATYMAAEVRRLSRRFAGWMSLFMGLFMLFLLTYRKW